MLTIIIFFTFYFSPAFLCTIKTEILHCGRVTHLLIDITDKLKVHVLRGKALESDIPNFELMILLLIL